MIERVLLICVNYHSEEETCNFLDELSKQQHNLSLHVIVVNNNEPKYRNGILEDLPKQYKNLSLSNIGRNLGYFGAASWAFKRYVKENALPDWVIVCNTDISFENRLFLSDLDSIQRNFNGAVIAPSIISSVTGWDQNPFFQHRPTRLRMHLYRLIFKYAPVSYCYETVSRIKNILMRFVRNSRVNKRHRRPSIIYAPHGAFLIFTRSYFAMGGTLEHGAFLFGEEVFVAESARRLGSIILYEPRLRVLHSEHITTSGSRDRFRYRYEAARYCSREYF